MAGLFVTDITPEQIENARKWIDALRSGKYEQTTGRLHSEGRYCCLGVACDVIGMERKDWDDWQILPDRQRRLLGLAYPDGSRIPQDWDAQQSLEGLAKLSLVVLNDNRKWDFGRIADVIEAELALVTEVTA